MNDLPVSDKTLRRAQQYISIRDDTLDKLTREELLIELMNHMDCMLKTTTHLHNLLARIEKLGYAV